MVCYWCYWGWPEPIVAIYERAYRDIEALGDSGEYALERGPAHVVWEDENWYAAAACLPDCDKPEEFYEGVTSAVMAIVKRSLEELVALPDEVKDVPAAYEASGGLVPRDYPPPACMGTMRRPQCV